MAPDAKAIEALLTPLRQKYLMQLKGWLAEIETLRPQLAGGQCSQKDINALKIKSHSLAGSGATYGFESISVCGRALEVALIGYQNAHPAEAMEQLDMLVAACRQALESLSADMAAGAHAAETAPPAAPVRKPLVMTVDDDAVLRGHLKGLFKDHAEMVEAESGRQALDMIMKRPPDLVILDDRMPGGMSGIELLQLMQKTPELAHIPVIMLTACDKPLEVMRGALFGAAEYVTKPFDSVQLLEKVCLRLKRFSTTVLIVDDDLTIRELLAHKFRQAGMRVEVADDGIQAVKVASEGAPRLIVLDIRLPRLDGVGVLRKLREIPHLRDVPVVFITAGTETHVQEELRREVADYIVKPFDVEEVVTRCLRLIKVT